MTRSMALRFPYQRRLRRQRVWRWALLACFLLGVLALVRQATQLNGEIVRRSEAQALYGKLYERDLAHPVLADSPSRGGEGGITVRPGDTLWAIAARNSGHEDDVRDIVRRIAVVNGLTSCELRPGQRLVMPLGEGVRGER